MAHVARAMVFVTLLALGCSGRALLADEATGLPADGGVDETALSCAELEQAFVALTDEGSVCARDADCRIAYSPADQCVRYGASARDEARLEALTDAYDQRCQDDEPTVWCCQDGEPRCVDGHCAIVRCDPCRDEGCVLCTTTEC
jgi:hypothetical protein